MLSHHKESMPRYLWHIPHGDFRVETRGVVREERFDKLANIPIARFFLAVYFILKDDAYIRPRKPDPTKPMFYRHFIWKVHNCGQRKDGTLYTAGNAALVIFEDGKEIFDSSKSNLSYEEIRNKDQAFKERLRNESGGEDLPSKG